MNPPGWFAEAGWSASENPHHLLHCLQKLAYRSQRKVRLLAAAGCRRVWQVLPEKHRQAVEAGERFADGVVRFETMYEAGQQCRNERSGYDAAAFAAAACTHREPWIGARDVLYRMLGCAWDGPNMRDLHGGGCWPDGTTWVQECVRLCDLIRDIFGSPYRSPPTLEPAWLEWHHATIPCLAQAIYQDRDFGHLPILADALEEAGCTNADILQHCRQPAEHVPGCWVIDRILQKPI